MSASRRRSPQPPTGIGLGASHTAPSAASSIDYYARAAKVLNDSADLAVGLTEIGVGVIGGPAFAQFTGGASIVVGAALGLHGGLKITQSLVRLGGDLGLSDAENNKLHSDTEIVSAIAIAILIKEGIEASLENESLDLEAATRIAEDWNRLVATYEGLGNLRQAAAPETAKFFEKAADILKKATAGRDVYVGFTSPSSRKPTPRRSPSKPTHTRPQVAPSEAKQSIKDHDRNDARNPRNWGDYPGRGTIPKPDGTDDWMKA